MMVPINKKIRKIFKFEVSWTKQWHPPIIAHLFPLYLHERKTILVLTSVARYYKFKFKFGNFKQSDIMKFDISPFNREYNKDLRANIGLPGKK